MSKYNRKIPYWDDAGQARGLTVDVYTVLLAFNVACPATQHAVKKLLMAGQRGHKDTRTDLQEALHAIERAIELLPPDEAKQ